MVETNQSGFRQEGGRHEFAPSIGVAVCGALWGLFWIPMRYLDQNGISGAWGALVLFACALLVLAPVAVIRRCELREAGNALWLTGLVTGSAFTLYATALVLTDVVSTLLLFYLSPVWSTVLGRLILDERIDPKRWLGIALGIAGLWVILGADHGIPWPRNAGDWMALLSGLAWAYGSVRVHDESARSTSFEPTFAFFLGGVVCAAALIALIELSAVDLARVPSVARVFSASPWIAATVFLYILPSMFLIIWAARRLSPGRVGLLLMTEIVVGVVTASLLANEPFGARESLGSLLIVSAGVIEVWRR